MYSFPVKKFQILFLLTSCQNRPQINKQHPTSSNNVLKALKNIDNLGTSKSICYKRNRKPSTSTAARHVYVYVYVNKCHMCRVYIMFRAQTKCVNEETKNNIPNPHCEFSPWTFISSASAQMEQERIEVEAQLSLERTQIEAQKDSRR